MYSAIRQWPIHRVCPQAETEAERDGALSSRRKSMVSTRQRRRRNEAYPYTCLVVDGALVARAVLGTPASYATALG